jgi:hypothetical protein
MSIKVKAQRDYLLTEFSVEASASDLDEVLKSIKASGKSITLYNNGSVQGINVEQKTKLTEVQSIQVRKIINVGDKIL